MFETLKRIIKVLIIKVSNSKKKLKIPFSCNLKYKNCNFEGANVLGRRTTFSGRMGYASYIGDNCSIDADIGRYCCIASNVKTINGLHPVETFVSIHPCFYSTKKQGGFTYVGDDKFEEHKFAENSNRTAVIGNDVWIGCRVTILPGITIGDGAIIGAGAVVTKNVEPYSIIGGVPAAEIRKRFDIETIQKLLKIRWWDKPESWIRSNAKCFDEIERFLKQK